jgi:hypothetical protein
MTIDWLTCTEAAARYDLAAPTVRSWARKGWIEIDQRGKWFPVLYSAQSIEKLLQERKCS